ALFAGDELVRGADHEQVKRVARIQALAALATPLASPGPAVISSPSNLERAMTLTTLIQGPLPVTAPLVLNPLMAPMIEAAGFGAGYLGGGATGYQKVALEANLNLTEMCQAAIDIRAVSSLPLILDGSCGFGDPMHMHRTIGMSEAAGFAAIEI